MITKSSRLTLSRNESIGDISADSNCDRAAPEGTSSEPSNEDAPVVYIESKIKSLLHQADGNSESGPSSSKEPETNQQPTVDDGDKPPEKTEERISSGVLATEDSCNAVDNKISSCDDETVGPAEELSFNGKIKSLNAPSEGSQSELAANAARKPLETTASTNEKVRKDKLNESFEILTKENSSLMHYNNEKSPDLFADDDDEDGEDGDVNDTDSCVDYAKSDSGEVAVIEDASISVDPIAQIEKTLLKKLQSSLSGVLPPPSVTYSRIEASRIVTLYRQNEDRLVYRNDQVLEQPSPSVPLESVCLNKPTHSPEELRQLQWPAVMKVRAHGVYYNHSPISEKIDMLGLKYVGH